MTKVCDLLRDCLQNNNNFLIENILQKPNKISLIPESNDIEINSNESQTNFHFRQQNSFSNSFSKLLSQKTIDESEEVMPSSSGEFILKY